MLIDPVLIDPDLARGLAQQRMSNLVRQAEQERLIRRLTRGSQTSQPWPRVPVSILSGLLKLVTGVRS